MVKVTRKLANNPPPSFSGATILTDTNDCLIVSDNSSPSVLSLPHPGTFSGEIRNTDGPTLAVLNGFESLGVIEEG